PPLSRGLHYAVQALLSDWNLLFFRVQEEGYSYKDYMQSLRMLGQGDRKHSIAALCAPGVGDNTLLNAMRPVCCKFGCILLANEADLYDYLTSASSGSV